MGNIVNYVKENGNLSFDQNKFNEVDALVLATLSYNNLSLLDVNKKNGFKYSEIKDWELKKNLVLKMYDKDRVIFLLDEVTKSKRFGDLKVVNFEEKKDMEKGLQFAAMSILLNDKAKIIVFRGTDSSFIGWSESLSLSYSNELLVQKLSEKYLEKEAENWHGEIIVIGHSKGGNLAVYSSAMADGDIQEKISKIYNLDGPGFLSDFFENSNFKNIRQKIVKIIPRKSVIGLLLNDKERTYVVEGIGNVIEQHAPLNWEVNESKFKLINEVDKIALDLNKAIDKWLEKFSLDERREIINVLFENLYKTGMDGVDEILPNWFESIKKLPKIYKSMEDEDYNMLKKAFSGFMSSYKEVIFGKIFNRSE